MFAEPTVRALSRSKAGFGTRRGVLCSKFFLEFECRFAPFHLSELMQRSGVFGRGGLPLLDSVILYTSALLEKVPFYWIVPFFWKFPFSEVFFQIRCFS